MASIKMLYLNRNFQEPSGNYVRQFLISKIKIVILQETSGNYDIEKHISMGIIISKRKLRPEFPERKLGRSKVGHLRNLQEITSGIS